MKPLLGGRFARYPGALRRAAARYFLGAAVWVLRCCRLPRVTRGPRRVPRSTVRARRGGGESRGARGSGLELPPLRAGPGPLRGMSCLLPSAALMGLLFARTMAWTSSGKTHPELVNNLYSE